MNHPQKLPYPRLLRITCATIGVLLTLPGSDTASAQSTLTWSGGGGNPNAANNGNWVGTAPAGGNDYDFVFNASDLVSPFRAGVTWNVANVGLLSLTLTGSGTTNFTWGGTSSIALKGGITVNSGDHTFNTTATVVNDATWDIAASSSLTRSSANTFTLGADRKITKTGAGTLLLTGANSGIAGVLEVQQGMLRVGANDALGSGTLALNGGTFALTANNTLTNTSAGVSVLGDSTLIVNRGGNAGSVIHLLGVLSAGAGKFRVESGDLITSTNTAEVVFGVTTLTNNATFETVNNGTGGTTRLTLGAVGETGGARGLTKSGNGELLLTAAGTFSGILTLSDGTVVAGDANALGTGNITFSSAGGNTGTIRYTSASAGTDWASRIKNSTGTIRLDTADNTVTLAGVIDSSNVDGLAKSGTGALGLAGANTFSGGTTLGEGTLRLDHINAAGTGTITQSSAASTLQINTTGTIANNMSVYKVAFLQSATLSGTITVNNAEFGVAADESSTISGVIAGTGGVNKTGLGQLTLTGDNTYTGAVAVNAGVLELASTLGGAAASTVSVSVASGARLLLSQSEQVNNAATVSLSGGTIQRGGNVSEVFGNLNLTTTSFLDYGAGNDAGTIRFGTYTPSALLTVQNFLPGNKLQFGDTISSTDLNNATLFSFSNGFTIGTESGFFTITAIPEPSTCLAGAGLLAMLLWPARRALLRTVAKAAARLPVAEA